MIDPEKETHVYPINDLKEHTIKCVYPSIGNPYCKCDCDPSYEEVGEMLLVIHNSFDGRENFEPDNEVRNN